MRQIVLLRRQVSEHAQRPGAFICVDPETLQVTLDARDATGSLPLCHGHEDMFPVCMAFEDDDIAAGRCRDFLEGGDWAVIPDHPNWTRQSDGIYRSYAIRWEP